jgi:hypothetical protein
MRRIILAFVCAAGACADDPPRPQGLDRSACERMREHMVDVRLEGVVDQRDAHRQALVAALGDDFVTRCETTTSRAAHDCVLAATSIDSIRSCTSDTKERAK